MKKATVVQVYTRRQLPPNVRQAVLVKLDEPIEYGDEKTTDHIYVSAAQVGRDDEVYIFPATGEGEVLDWLELDGSRRGTLSIREVMSEAGYDVSSWPEEIK